MASRIQYLSVTFLEDVMFGVTLVPTGTTISLQRDVARGLYGSVRINGPGDASGAPLLGAGTGASNPVTVSPTTGVVVGTTLTATFAPGWGLDGKPGSGFQWNRDGAPISGATNSTYTLVSADGGHLITLTVSGLVYTPTGVTVPPVTVVAWDDTLIWNDTATWAD